MTHVDFHFRQRSKRRHGATMVESVVVLAICLLLLLGMLDLSIAIVRYVVMSESARRIAREAIVHGHLATPAKGTWGPAAVSTNAANNDPFAATVRGLLVTLNPSDVGIELTWPDGGNRTDQRVQVTVNYTHQPIIRFPGWYSSLQLQGMSTMRVAH